MAKRYFRRSKIKSVVSAIAVVAILIASIAGLTALFNKDTKGIRSTAFDVGAINAEGNFVESDRSIYTKNLFECQGLTVEPDFEAAGTYQVFYYDTDKNFIGATTVMNSEDGAYTKGTTFPVAKYARIMITPDVPIDENGYLEEDFKIRFYQVIGYANDYTITVNKKQDFRIANLFVEDPANAGKICGGRIGEPLGFDGASDKGCIKPIDVSSFKAIRITFPDGAADSMYSYCFLDSEGVVVAGGGNTDKASVIDLSVPEGATQFICSYTLGKPFVINQSR